MKKRMYLAAGLLVVGSAAQAQNAGKDDAVALVRKAVAHLKKDGVEAACRDFADPRGGFRQGDLYVFVQDMHSTMVCHAANKRINGKDLSALKDADGKLFSAAMTELAKTKGAGWVDYRWVNPSTQVIEPKTSYVEKVNDTLWLGVGIYRR
ncbi:cache domain-containing protein [Janthinobacterium sp.]|uniref:cache domain-containing protein n=1 Tax=Janthinobacterium sp. TaxID=1871054 RepID=UPI00293D9631|nr:cache domain-containing protein [Janthinobacterium sp.]